MQKSNKDIRDIDPDVNVFTEKDFIQNFRMSRVALNCFYFKSLMRSQSKFQAKEGHKSCIDSDLTIQTEVALKKSYLCLI